MLTKKLKAIIFPNKIAPTIEAVIPINKKAILDTLLTCQNAKLWINNQIPKIRIPIPAIIVTVKTLNNGNIMANKPNIMAKIHKSTFPSFAKIYSSIIIYFY